MALQRLIVFVYLPSETRAVPAGIFSYDANLRAGRFEYGVRYVERPNALAVDAVALPLGVPALPVTVNDGLYGAFRDSAPDYWGRLVLASERGTVPESLSEIDCLRAANATRVGNLDFRDTPDSPEPILGPPHFSDLNEIVQAAEEIENGQSPHAHLVQLLRQGTSMGGARPKCTIEWNEDLWIVKFPARNDSVTIPVIEYATMKLAQRCGIHIPPIEMLQIGKRNAYAIKRFDREKVDGGWTRQGYLSSLSLLQLDDRDRFDWSYLRIAAQMRRFCPAQDLQQLFRRMVFNICVRNTDDHPRNHGFLVSRTGLQLSPAFDIVPSITQRGINTDFSLAMTVGTTGREATFQNALSGAHQFGLSPIQARTLVDEVRETVSGWRTMFIQCGVSQRELLILEPSMTC